MQFGSDLKKIRFIVCMAMSLFACSSAQRKPSTVHSSEMMGSSLESLSQNIASKFSATHIDPTDSTFLKASQFYFRQSSQLLQKMNIDGSFNDLNYAELPETTWTVSTHFTNLKTLAITYQLPGQALFQDAALLKSIIAGLAYGNQFFKQGTCTYAFIDPPRKLPQCGNWYQWILGIPNDLGLTLFLMRNQIPKDIFQNSLDAIVDHIGARPLAFQDGEPIMTGANLQDLIMAHLFATLLMGEENNLTVLTSAEASLCKKANGDGIRRDDSFSQHGKILNGVYSGQVYNDGYGAEFATRFAQFVNFTAGTAFGIDQNALDVCSEFLYKGIDWSIYKGHWDVSLIGRAIARAPNLKASYNPLIVLSQIQNAYQTELQADASLVAQDPAQNYLVPIDWLQSTIQLKNMAIKPGSEPSVLRLYPDSDYAIYRSSNFYLSLKLLSERTISGENTLFQNKKGSRLSDGFMYLTQTGSDFNPPALISPTLDWAHLPGTTVEFNGNTANSVYGSGLRNFVGSVGDGRHGVAAMDFQPVPSDPKNPALSTLRAKKSYFFFDQAIVFLGTAISSQSSNPVQTTIDQRLIPQGVSSFWVDGTQYSTTNSVDQPSLKSKWAWINGIGYQFLDGNPLHLKAGNQSGSLADMSVGPPTVQTNYFVNLIEEHGASPTSGSYAYAIYPQEPSMSSFQADLAQPRFNILKNDESASIVENFTDHTVGAVLWQKGSFDQFSVDSPSVFYLTETLIPTHHKILCIADPTQKLKSMILTVPLQYKLVPNAENQVTELSSDSISRKLQVTLRAGFTLKLEFAVD